MMAIDRPRKGETAAEFFRRRSKGSTLDGLDRILAKVPDRPPEPGDELPEGWTPDRLRTTGYEGDFHPPRPKHRQRRRALR
jgi:hypothetical protein